MGSISRFTQEQTHTRGASIDDTLSPPAHDASAKHLGDTLDYMCSQLRTITGKAAWETAPDASLAELSARTAMLSWGADSVGSTVRTRYLWPGYHDGLAERAAVGIEVPRAGTLRRLRIRQNDPGGSGGSVTYTVEVGGAPTAISVTMPSTSLAAADLVGTFAVPAGGVVAIRVTKAAGITASPRNVTATLELV